MHKEPLILRIDYTAPSVPQAQRWSVHSQHLLEGNVTLDRRVAHVEHRPPHPVHVVDDVGQPLGGQGVVEGRASVSSHESRESPRQ